MLAAVPRLVLMLGVALAGAARADDALLDRLGFDLPRGYAALVSSTADTREWTPERWRAAQPARIVLLERPRGPQGAPQAALAGLHRLLATRCPGSTLETLPRAAPALAEAAARGILTCPEHAANGRGLVVVEDVIAVGDRYLVAKLAFDYPPFRAGARPLTRGQQASATALLDSIRLAAPLPGDPSP